jgi:hypothetical protein
VTIAVRVADFQDCSWSPQLGPQDDLCCCPFPEVFFGGARGGGKTDGVLGKWALKERRYGRHFNAIMFRRTAVSAEDAIERSKEIYGPLGGRFHDQKLRWRMPNGGRVSFRYLENVQDANEYQGRNVTDAWVEEAGQYATPTPIDRLYGVLRSSHGVPVQLILTANPGGAGQHWIRDRYGLHPFPAKPKVLRRRLPTGDEHCVAVIPSRITDNRILLSNDPGYVSRLHLVGSEQLVKAWLEGDWTAIEGAFLSEWSEALHVVQPFAIPETWLRFRSGDWGSVSPFSIGWWAVVGDETKIGDADNRRTLPRGALVRYREWYGAQGGKLTAEQVGEGIVARERDDRAKLTYGVLDPSAFAEDGGPSIAERMNAVLLAAKLTAFREADNARVTRQSGDAAKAGPMGGWDLMRARFVGDGKNGKVGVPMIYTFATCRDSIRTIPVLQHDARRAEDLDTDAEDHAADDWRYACMSRPWVKSAPRDEGLKRDPYREASDDRGRDSMVTL